MYKLDELSPTVRHQILTSGIPFKSIGMEFSDLEDTNAKATVQKWVSTVQAGGVIKSPGSPLAGLGLLLVGSPGHGKTTLASVALQELIRTIPGDLRNPVGAFMDYPKLLRLKKSTWSEEDEKVDIFLKKVYGDAGASNLGVFVLDDIGKEYRTASGWAENVFDELLRSRYNAGLPTIITTNVELAEWDKYGPAMESFAHEAFVNVAVKAPRGDRRKNEG
jgi:DNA replication protein DnaC